MNPSSSAPDRRNRKLDATSQWHMFRSRARKLAGVSGGVAGGFFIEARGPSEEPTGEYPPMSVLECVSLGALGTQWKTCPFGDKFIPTSRTFEASPGRSGLRGPAPALPTPGRGRSGSLPWAAAKNGCAFEGCGMRFPRTTHFEIPNSTFGILSKEADHLEGGQDATWPFLGKSDNPPTSHWRDGRAFPLKKLTILGNLLVHVTPGVSSAKPCE